MCLLANLGQWKHLIHRMSEPSSVTASTVHFCFLSWFSFFFFFGNFKLILWCHIPSNHKKCCVPAWTCACMWPICVCTLWLTCWRMRLPWRRRNTRCLAFSHKWRTHTPSIQSLCSSLFIFCRLSFRPVVFYPPVSHSICPVISVNPLFVWHLVLLVDLYPYFIIRFKPLLHNKPSVYPFSISTLHSLVHSFFIFHRFNRMYLGHISILCNWYHLGEKLRQSDGQTKTHTHTQHLMQHTKKQSSLPML